MPEIQDPHSISRQQLKAFIDRIERLEQDKAGIADDIKDCYGEAKALGYDAKILRKVVAIRRRRADEVREENELLEIYLSVIDDQLPLFEPEQQAA